MATRLSDPITADQLNEHIRRIDILEKKMAEVNTNLGIVQQAQSDTQETTDKAYFNTVIFTWTGGSLTLSWNASYVRDKQSNVYPIKAGSRVVSPSTSYWTAWNYVHKQMVIESDLTKITVNKNNLLLGSLKTGTGIQTGDAGGGGTEPGDTGPGFGRYSKF